MQMLFPTIVFAIFSDNVVANIANFVRDIFLHIVVPEILVENFAKCDQSSQDGLCNTRVRDQGGRSVWYGQVN